MKQTITQPKPAKTRRSSGTKKAFAFLFVACACAAALFGFYRSRHKTLTNAERPAATTDSALISAVVTDEETCLRLAPKMAALSKGLLDLHLPAQDAGSIFAPSVTVADVGPAPTITSTNESMLESHPWPVVTAARR